MVNSAKTTFSLLVVAVLVAACGRQERTDYPFQPVPFTKVKITDRFWKSRIETNRKVTIPFALQQNEETGRVRNFAIAAGLEEGKYQGRRFNDTDVYKVIEGAAYSLHLHPDPELEKILERLIDLISQAQEPDGYLYAARTADPANPAPGAGPERWSRLRGSHELYNAGHMYEAAVAYYQATGKTRFLEVAKKNADLLVEVFGPNKRRDFPGHQEIEIGLAKLYRVTGKSEYLELAKFFLDERGKKHDGELYDEDSPFALYNRKAYMQDHLPVLEQTEAVGHAVRASYMYSGMADVAALTGSEDYIAAIDRLWDNVVSKKLYLTGGIGAHHTTEAFGEAYVLPNETAYTETCASIGNAFWNHRQFLLHGDAKYIDVLERILYNGVLSGVSLSGDRFFYQNPLESSGDDERSPWFEVACCPGNVTRLLPSVPGYIYAQRDEDIYANLFVASTAEFEANDVPVRIELETLYPWEGNIRWNIEPERATELTFHVRIPGWARNQPLPSDLYAYVQQKPNDIRLKVNGDDIDLVLDRGFVPLKRVWQNGDSVELVLPMPVRRVVSHEKIEANAGKVALERGPLVYCAEWPDNQGTVLDITLADDTELNHEFEPNLLGGIVVIKGQSVAVYPSKGRDLVAIPYYAWSHRGKGEMAVWLTRE